MPRGSWLFVLGVLTGTALTFATGFILSAIREPRYTNMTGPVAIIRREDTKHGYLGIEFSNEPSRSLYVADCSRAVAADGQTIRVGDRLTSLNGQPVQHFQQIQQF